MTTPVDRINAGKALPADLVQLEEARKEAKRDLQKLLAWFAENSAKHGEAVALSRLTQGMLDQPWSHLDLATALGEAVALLNYRRDLESQLKALHDALGLVLAEDDDAAEVAVVEARRLRAAASPDPAA